MRILVTGGAGYIGGACLRAALAAGHAVTVIDNLSTGHADSLPPGAPLTRADLREQRWLDPLLAASDAVLHFAARSLVGESMADPVGYYRDNLGSFLALLAGMERCGPRLLVISSSAAVYGHGEGRPFVESDPCRPVNPYGGTKLAMEQVLAHAAPRLGLAYLSLRYFNAAGALADHGERHAPETHLIPLALAALRGGAPLTLFGEDYPTPDGTCIRDYVHVADLAAAHLTALTGLAAGRLASGPLNLGSGRGHSVREVIASVERVTGRPLPLARGERRPGDPAYLVAGVEAARRELGWTVAQSGLDAIVESAWSWLERGSPGPAGG